jgi:hypothetical protein
MAALFGSLTAAAAVAQPLEPFALVELRGDLAYPDQLSGAAVYRDLLVVTPDEGAELNVFRPDGAHYALLARPTLLEDADQEIDMEASAADGDELYVVGSHSMRRKKLEEGAQYKKNRKRLTRVTPHEHSYQLYRLQLDQTGAITAADSISLSDILENDEVLAPYVDIPGKENGVDIEGLARRDGRLFVGFRGPVLRGNYVPVVVFEFDNPDDYEVRYVQLAGRGVRDLVAVDDGLLVVAGPVGDGDASYKLYLWNGEDCIPGNADAPGALSEVGELPASAEIKPEGLALLGETPDHWELLTVSDGAPNATRWLVPKP